MATENEQIDLCVLNQSHLIEIFEDSFNGSEPNDTTVQDFLINVNNHCEHVLLHKWISIIVPIIFAVIVLVGIGGNILVLLVVILKQQMRNTTNVLMLNLAISDLFFVIVCVPPTAFSYRDSWPFGDLGCRIVQYIIHVTCYSSVMTLVYLSLDRYLAVVYPVKSISWRTVCNAVILICITWIIILAGCIPIFFLYHETTFQFGIGTENKRYSCTFNREHPEKNHEKWFQTLFFVTSLAIPLLCILCFYLNMLVRLWKGSAATHGPGPMRDKNNACKGKENKVRVTRMVIIVIIVFAICWVPLQLVLLLKAYNVYSIRTGRASVIFQIFANCMAYGNSCLNPILYAFFSTNYRQAFWSIICCGRRSNPAHIHVNGNCEMEYQTGKPTFHKSPPILNIDGENATLGNRDEDTNAGIELHPLLKDGQKLGVMKQARTQETIYNPSFFATEANQQNGLLHEVKATLH